MIAAVIVCALITIGVVAYGTTREPMNWPPPDLSDEAERIADQLDEWAGDYSYASAGGAYWEGYLEGAAQAQREAAHLIRERLVKEAP